MTSLLVIKIMSEGEWEATQRDGFYHGSPDDRRDGFIHLSAPGQVRGTVEKHFAGRDNLVLVSIDSRKLGSALRWEASRGGALYPHLYAPLPLAAVVKAERLGKDETGKRIYPQWLPD